MKVRNDAFDAVKGFLIVLVVLGHVLLGSINENLNREIIYFFHMPLFLAITGFFISEKVIHLSLFNIIKKYWDRLIIPYLVAFVFYTFLIFYFSGEFFSFKYLVSKILYPYYHLWYIPAVILFVFYLKLLDFLYKKWEVIFYVLLLLFFMISVFFESYGQSDISEKLIYIIFGDKRFYYFFFYFYTGYFLSKNKINIPIDIVIVVFVVSVMGYGNTSLNILSGFGKVIANISIIYLVIKSCSSEFSIRYKSTIFSIIGRLSLPIYLWHVAPLLVLKSFHLSNEIYYSISVIVFVCCVFILRKLEGKNKHIDLLVFGKIQNP
ncbi:acyltransferase family protein [Photobacterium leiognathi]|uniref:acyltransferase family protein n=1 Tax=Photobacterium leiognathi TaxID=553611 RepID=UPI0027338474|nr:acyltransferase family protein [Photobacterium leiognathi]